MHIVQKILERAGYTTRAYSGRGMYGAKCLGVPTDESLGGVIANIIECMEDPLLAAFEKVGQCEELQEVANAVRRVQTDSLGRGIIVYFPGIEHEASEEEDEEEEEECEDV